MKNYELSFKDLEEDKTFVVKGTKLKNISKKSYTKCHNCFESIVITTDIDAIKVVVPVKGHWAVLIDRSTHKPYGFIFKQGNKRTGIKVFIKYP